MLAFSLAFHPKILSSLDSDFNAGCMYSNEHLNIELTVLRL